LSALIVFFLGRAHSLGVHCGDDALNATVAKNLVAGLGYGSTLNSGKLQLFDLAITTGPAVILPTALGIAVAGNRPWVPGTASVLLWGTLLVGLYGILKKTRVGGSPGALRDAAVFFLVSIPLLFPFHFELWSSLLGEVAAALFLLIAFALAGGSLSKRRVFLAGMACALATLSKLLAAPGFAMLLGVLAARSILNGKKNWRKSAGLLLACGLGFAAPLIVFEGYKVASLGGASPYLEYVGRKTAMVGKVGIPKSLQSDATVPGAAPVLPWTQRAAESFGKTWNLAKAHDTSFRERVGLSAWQVLITALAALLVVCRSGLSPRAWMAIATAAQVWVLGGYYLFFSSGLPRHFLIGLILWIGLVALALASLSGRTRLAATALVLAFLYSENHEKLAYPALVMDGGFFQPSEDLRGALEIARAIDAERAAFGGDRLYVSQAWPMAADVEFYSKNTGVFRRHTLLGDSKNFTVVYNKRFAVLEDAKFQETLAKCGPPEMETQNHVLLRSKPAAD
jgi:hypothetical protein